VYTLLLQVDVIAQDSVAVLEGVTAVAGDRLALLYMRDAYEQVIYSNKTCIVLHIACIVHVVNLFTACTTTPCIAPTWHCISLQYNYVLHTHCVQHNELTITVPVKAVILDASLIVNTHVCVRLAALLCNCGRSWSCVT
jgi:hypothetical protein